MTPVLGTAIIAAARSSLKANIRHYGGGETTTVSNILANNVCLTSLTNPSPRNDEEVNTLFFG